MSAFFSVDYHGPAFQLFGWAHLTMLGVISLILVGLISWGGNIPSHLRIYVRYGFAALLIANELFWHVWVWGAGQWKVQTMLPLHFCSVAVILSVFMLLTKSQRLYELVYFIGISGAILALLTPAMGRYGAQHALFYQFFISHGMIIVAAVYMSVVECFRPTWRALIRVSVVGILYMLLVSRVNLLLDSNYLFIAQKPEEATTLDILPPWPWNIPFMVLGMLLMMLFLYYLISKKRDRVDGSIL
ncbi:YwaF family protein [Magnetococcus sp. PR-3]|uniref:YwaF family protein n=1 Tax=Magnetococcus sp. PR-3 TaxID=3120355 RepID=UPI002FCE1C69